MNAPRAGWEKFLACALGACLFLIVVGAKWATFDRYGSPMPDWDQWDAEALELLIPWFTHDHFLSHLFHPHNEHRILLTKLQNLALVLLNGQWDSRLEAVTNALLHAALAVAFWRLVRRETARRWHAPFFVLVAALFGLPLAWQNVLGGFHSQQYWLLLLSFVALTTLPSARAGEPAWWLGSVSAVLALGSMASGFLAAAVVGLMILLRIWREGLRPRDFVATFFLAGIISAVGLLTRVEFPQHAALKARGTSDFFWSMVHSLQWPMGNMDLGALVMWIPLGLLAWQVLGRRDASRAGWSFLALGMWVLVQIVATAYARGVGGDYPASRYMDTLQFGVLANGLALAWLASPARFGHYQPGLVVLGVLWLGGLGFGMYQNLHQAFSWDLPHAKGYYLNAEAGLHRYLLTGNPDELEQFDLPYPDANALKERLNDPALKPLLPVPIRVPLALSPAQPEPLRHDAPFLRNELPDWHDITPLEHGLSFETPALATASSWGSFALGGAASQGEWRSAPVPPPPFAWLKFETAGNLGEPGVSLELRAAGSDALLATVQPTHVPHNSWRAAYVRTPTVPFVVVARDRDAARWLAFSPPVEMGALSYWAWQAAKNGLTILYGAVAASLVLGALCGWRILADNSLSADKGFRDTPDRV